MLRAAGLRTGPALLFARRLSTCARPSLRARAGGGAARLVANSPFRPAVGRVAAIGAQRRAFSDTVLISVPSMGDSISEGDIGVVNVAAGDVVNADDVLCEIETDKVTSEVTTPVSGTVAEVLVEEGDTVIVNQELFKVTPGEGVAVPKAAAETPAAPSPPRVIGPTPTPTPGPRVRRHRQPRAHAHDTVPVRLQQGGCHTSLGWGCLYRWGDSAGFREPRGPRSCGCAVQPATQAADRGGDGGNHGADNPPPSLIAASLAIPAYAACACSIHCAVWGVAVDIPPLQMGGAC
eukprot:COSAG01_NODE_10322_length_2193_cov_2.908309_1_plen_292_part_00